MPEDNALLTAQPAHFDNQGIAYRKAHRAAISKAQGIALGTSPPFARRRGKFPHDTSLDLC